MRTTYVYRPDHHMANEFGMVKKEDLYTMMDDMRGSFGNEAISVHVISDTMEPTRHMANGKYYTSKKKFRDETRARGCIEVGNETSTLLKPRKRIELSKEQRKNDIRRAVWEIRNGRNIRNEF